MPSAEPWILQKKDVYIKYECSCNTSRVLQFTNKKEISILSNRLSDKTYWYVPKRKGHGASHEGCAALLSPSHRMLCPSHFSVCSNDDNCPIFCYSFAWPYWATTTSRWTGRQRFKNLLLVLKPEPPPPTTKKSARRLHWEAELYLSTMSLESYVEICYIHHNAFGV